MPRAEDLAAHLGRDEPLQQGGFHWRIGRPGCPSHTEEQHRKWKLSDEKQRAQQAPPRPANHLGREVSRPPAGFTVSQQRQPWIVDAADSRRRYSAEEFHQHFLIHDTVSDRLSSQQSALLKAKPTIELLGWRRVMPAPELASFMYLAPLAK